MMYEVIVVDDSLLMRTMLKRIIDAMEGFSVVDTASDAYDAKEKIKLHEPDLVTIDINMPKMDGIIFLKNLMRLHPMPALIITSEYDRHYEALESGAAAFVLKTPASEPISVFEKRIHNTLVELIPICKQYKLQKIEKKTAGIKTAPESENDDTKHHPNELLPSRPAKLPGKKIVVIGASTGGVEALMKLFMNLPLGLPPIVVVQHIPFGFSQSFTRRLNTVSQLEVKEAREGEILQKSCAYVASGDSHLLIDKNGDGEYVSRLVDGIKISRHKPSVDILFRSANNAAGGGAMAVIMTGMGDDGAIGIKELFENRAYTIAQSEKTSVVYGMAAKAVGANAITEIVDLEDIGKKISAFSEGNHKRGVAK